MHVWVALQESETLITAFFSTWQEYSETPAGECVSPEKLQKSFGCGVGDPVDAFGKLVEEFSRSDELAWQALGVSSAVVPVFSKANELPSPQGMTDYLAQEDSLAEKTMLVADIQTGSHSTKFRNGAMAQHWTTLCSNVVPNVPNVFQTIRTCPNSLCSKWLVF